MRRDNEVLKRELAGMGPSRRMLLRERGGYGGDGKGGEGGGGLARKMAGLRVSDHEAGSGRSSAGSVSPTKRVRKFGGRDGMGG